jgi:hypothetical protein
VIKLLDAFDSRKGNCLQSAFTGLHLPDGTNSQMALIYRRSPRKIARKAPASQMQAGRCNNCLIRSGEFDIFIVAQKSLIPRVHGRLESCPFRSPGPGPGPGQVQVQVQVQGQGQLQGGARAQGDGQGQVRARAEAIAGQSSQRFLAWTVFEGLSPEALPWQCLPGRCQFPGAHGMVRGIPCAGSTFPSAGLPNRVCHCWGGHC